MSADTLIIMIAEVYLLLQVSTAELLVTKWQVGDHRVCWSGKHLPLHCGSGGPRYWLR